MHRLAVCFVVLLCSCGREDDPPEAVGEVDDSLTICSRGKTVEGIDVSHWNGKVDWVQVQQSGRRFAIMKATENTTYFDDTFVNNWTMSQAAGLVRGAYHFFHADTNPVAQADYFLQHVPLSPSDLPPVLDLETTQLQSGAKVAANALAWLERVEAQTGRRPILYTYPAFWPSIGNPSGFAKYPLWIANYGVKCPKVPGQWTGWPFWQYSSKGAVPGISGNVDLNVFNGTYEDLLEFVSGSPSLNQLNGNDALSVVSWATGQVELFAVSQTGQLVHVYTDGPAAADHWSASNALDEGAACGFAAGFSGAGWGSRPELFSPRAEGGVGHLWQSPQWNKFQPFGDTKLTHLQTLRQTDGRLEVFALGPDQAIWRNEWAVAKGDWTGWQSLGGKFTTGVSALLAGDAQTELFATNAEGMVWRNAFGGKTWSGWSALGGQMASRPVALRFPDGHLELFARGLDGKLYHRATSSGLEPFELLGSGKIASEPSVVWAPGPGNGPAGPEVFVRDSTGRVVHLFAGSNGYQELGPIHDQPVASDPLAWVADDGTVLLFAIAEDGRLLHSVRKGGGDWSSWTPLLTGMNFCPPLLQPRVDMGGGAMDADSARMAAAGCSCEIGGPGHGRSAGEGAMALLSLCVGRGVRKRRLKVDRSCI